MTLCGICGHDIDGDEVDRRESGDFHRACFDGLRIAGIGVKNCGNEAASCHLCSQRVARGAPIVEFIGINAVTHLRCFFGTVLGRTRSVGACAARLSVRGRRQALRDQSGALVALSRRLIAARPVWAT